MRTSTKTISIALFVALWGAWATMLPMPTSATALVVTLSLLACCFGVLAFELSGIVDAHSFLAAWLFIVADSVTIGQWPDATGTAAYLLLCLGVGMMSSLVFRGISNKSAATTLTTLLWWSLYLVPLFYLIYYLSFDAPVNDDVIHAVLQTDVGEAIDFLRTFVPTVILLAIGVSVLSVALSLHSQRRSSLARDGMAATTVLSLLCLVLAFGTDTRPRILRSTYSAVDEYVSELREFTVLQNARAASLAPSLAAKSDLGEVHVVVIGESLARDHMSLYEYPRETNPRLGALHARNELVRLTNAYSTHTHTVPVLTLALTGADQRHPESYIRLPSIIDIAKAAGFEVTWITNQQVYGAWDNGVSILAKSADKVVSLNRFIGTTLRTRVQDEAVLQKFGEVIDRSPDRNRLVFIHLAGSHSPYCSRFPSRFRRFSGPLRRSTFGDLADEVAHHKTNCYDNSVVYNDWVVSTVLDSLRSRESQVKSLLYFSDHGEDVFAGKGHNSRLFTYRMVRIPVIVWLSDTYRSRHPDLVSSLMSNQAALFPSDYLYDTMLGLYDINTPAHDQTHDLTSSEYTMDDSSAYSVWGEYRYVTPGNQMLVQRRNIERVTQGTPSRVIPHRVNTIGVLRQVLATGFRGFEVDLFFRPGDEPYFEVGHDSTALSGAHLDEYLRVVADYNVDKIWLDIKNATVADVPAIKEELLRIEEEYELQGKLIVESSLTSETWSDVGRQGFHTSYYLPEARINIESDVGELEAFANEVAQIVRSTDASAVSFQSTHYDFVKSYLEPRVDKTIVYHVWDLTLMLKNQHFSDLILERPYFTDPRVQTLLVVFESPYRL